VHHAIAASTRKGAPAALCDHTSFLLRSCSLLHAGVLMDHTIEAAAPNDDMAMRSSSQRRYALLPQQQSQQHGKVIRLFHLRYLGSPWRAGLRSAGAAGLLARLENNGLGAGGVCSVDGPGVWAAQAPAAREGRSGDVLSTINSSGAGGDCLSSWAICMSTHCEQHAAWIQLSGR
jgi:hypothetical protein